MRCAQLSSKAGDTHILKHEFNYNTGKSVSFLNPVTDGDESYF